MKKIPFNVPYLTGNEIENFKHALEDGKLSGDGPFTKKCNAYFEKRYNFKKVLLTTSGTDALELAALLINLKEGDEVIIPSFTFVSSANAFILRGAKIIFADSAGDNPNMDADKIEALITPRTKAIVPVHYAGLACDMDTIMDLAKKYNLYVIEDAAQSIDGFYKNSKGEMKPLGSIGHMAAFSFHETKNIISGEGGMLVVNDDAFTARAEVIREKGTNRSAFFRGEIDKYGWVEPGSSFLPADTIAAFLYAQLEKMDEIQALRKKAWQTYYRLLAPLEKEGKVKLQAVPAYTTNNWHMFYLVLKSLDERTAFMDYLKEKNIHAVFHYQSLHNSVFYKDKHSGAELANADMFTNQLVRLPLYAGLGEEDATRVAEAILDFFKA